MEIQYKRTYTPGFGKRYNVGETSALLGFAMEIADPRVRMQEGKMAPGQICVLLFGLTPQEYALKDSDAKALDALADKLAKNVPADRLMGWRIMDLKGAPVQSALRPRTGESIDGGEFARQMRAKASAGPSGPLDAQLMEVRRLQNLCAAADAAEETKQEWQAAKKALGEALLGLKKVYAAYDAASGGRWPSVGFDGRMELFTLPERAERVRRQLSDAQAGVELWSVRVLTAAELKELLISCMGDGLDLLRVDNGFAAAELNIRDFCPAVGMPNAALRSMMIREVQYGLRWNQLKGAGAEEAKTRSALEGMLTLRNFVWRETGNALLYALCAGGNREKCVMLSGKDKPEKMLAVFTEPGRAKSFAARMQEKVQPVEMRFDELAQRGAVCEGMILDMGFIGYRLQKADFDKVKDLRNKPPMVVRIQAENAPKPAVKSAGDMGSLPNPDDYAAVPKREAPAPEASPAAPAPEPEARKGFFKKLFGK